jgi:hypothetical protein
MQIAEISFCILEVGYPSNYGNVKIMLWDQRDCKHDQSHPEPGSITRVTTLSFWRGFRMMLPVLTTLTGFDGKMALRARRATDPRGGA